jgi:hypothetical protein
MAILVAFAVSYANICTNVEVEFPPTEKSKEFVLTIVLFPGAGIYIQASMNTLDVL